MTAIIYDVELSSDRANAIKKHSATSSAGDEGLIE
jgi:hypothetical protein